LTKHHEPIECRGERDGSPVFGAQRASEAGCRSVAEQIDNRAREFYEIADNKLDWATRQAGDLAERYLDADLNLVVRVGDAARQHVAVFRRLRSIDGIQFRGQRTETIESNASRDFRKNEQPLVLANIVQTIKGKQSLSPP
jgi:hypothetical protein